MREQRDIVSTLNGEMLNYSHIRGRNVSKEGVEGALYFSMAKENLKELFESLDGNSALTSGSSNYSNPSITANIKYNEEQYAKESSTMSYYQITNDNKKAYECAATVGKITIAYEIFYRKQRIVGHYFRHLYHILHWMRDLENEDLNGLDKYSLQEKKRIKDKYFQYARFIQAQMSDTELVLLFYDTFLFPRMKDLVVHYNLLDNLWNTSLIQKGHDCIADYNLKK